MIDTACTRTVCGGKWLEDYTSGLPQSELLKVDDKQSARPFRFGDGKVVYSTRKVTIPAKNLTEDVPADIPMLLSKASLKRASAVLDIANDKATMFKQPVKLEQISSGHYCVNLRDDSNLDEKETSESKTQIENEIIAVTENMTTKEKERKYTDNLNMLQPIDCKNYWPAQVITMMKATQSSRTLLKTVIHVADTASQNISL